MTSYSDRELLALDQVEDLLEAYAEARFGPSGLVLARMRAQVLAQATTMAAIDVASRNVLETGDAKRSRWDLPHIAFPRRVAALGMAASLMLATTAAVLAAPPGSPFYNARVSIETALLPSQAADRLASHAEHLAARLAEAAAAAARGDVAQLDAALAAYRTEVDAALAEVGEDGDLLAQLEAMLGRHVAALTALETSLPDEGNVANALQNSQKAIEKIKAKGDPGAGKPSAKPGPPDNENRQQR